MCINPQSISIFQESDSGRFLFANQEELLLHRNQSGVFFQLTFILIFVLQVKGSDRLHMVVELSMKYCGQIL